MSKRRDEGGLTSGMRALIFLGLALVAGAGATVLVYQVVATYQQQIIEASAPEPMVQVVVAAGDLYPGVPILESDIVGVDMPAKYVPDDAFTSAELVVGRIPKERVLANEFVRPSRLADGSTGDGLNALIPQGMRAISINIDDGNAVSGFLAPGNRVDMLITLSDTNGDRQTITILQTVPVLAVNNKMLNEEPADPEAPPKRAARPVAPSVTLAVTPDQAEIIAHVSRLGPLTLTMRSNGDVESVPTVPMTTFGLLPDAMQKRMLAAVPPPPKPVRGKVEAKPSGRTVVVILGSEKREIFIPD